MRNYVCSIVIGLGIATFVLYSISRGWLHFKNKFLGFITETERCGPDDLVKTGLIIGSYIFARLIATLLPL